MAQTHSIGQDTKGNPITRIIAFLYGIVAYLVFFATFLYAVGFVSGLLVPKTIARPAKNINFIFFSVSFVALVRLYVLQWRSALM